MTINGKLYSNILLVFALESEAGKEFESFNKLFVGVGKIKATYHLIKAIQKSKPDLIINLGTAGSTVFDRGSIVNCNHFIQRDMDVRALGFKKFETPISDNEVTFENAWGICDEDIYNQSLKFADNAADKKSPFFQFVMTTSNHKPYTFPDGKIDMKQGSRESAVKYTDYALGKFLKEARKRSWFKNSVFVIVADHCASSAGKWEINISKHHIPAIIYNMNQRDKIDRLTSQIDVMPTLFGYFGWQYRTALYGKDINKTKPGDERAFIGNYRTLGILKQNIFTQLNDHKQVHQFIWQKENDNMKETKPGKYPDLVNETISYYQSASERFKSGKMKELNNQ
ncbi:sulfatase-like hydrolase/transferase [Flavobacterium sp. U410]